MGGRSGGDRCWGPGRNGTSPPLGLSPGPGRSSPPGLPSSAGRPRAPPCPPPVAASSGGGRFAVQPAPTGSTGTGEKAHAARVRGRVYAMDGGMPLRRGWPWARLGVPLSPRGARGCRGVPRRLPHSRPGEPLPAGRNQVPPDHQQKATRRAGEAKRGGLPALPRPGAVPEQGPPAAAGTAPDPTGPRQARRRRTGLQPGEGVGRGREGMGGVSGNFFR